MVTKPTNMVKIAPNSFCIIKNPICTDEAGNIERNSFGEVTVRFEELEIRTSNEYSDPFPLYPYEVLH